MSSVSHHFCHSLWDFFQEREERAPNDFNDDDDDDEFSALGIPYALRLAILAGSVESWSDDDLYNSD